MKLCYVDDAWAWFIDGEVADAWGDDWNDAPHFCNAGDPYNGRDGDRSYVKVAFDGDLENFGCSGKDDPLGVGNGWFSVEQFNAREVPWICTIPYGERPLQRRNEIWAGCSLAEFRELVAAAGGTVYEPAPSLPRRTQ